MYSSLHTTAARFRDEAPSYPHRHSRSAWVDVRVRLFVCLYVCITQQEGWLSPTERASVSAISRTHILASPGYAPRTIAVNVTWMERGFNAGQMHSSIYPSIFNRLRAIARYWSEIATFSYPLAFNAVVGVFPLEFRKKVWSSEN